MNRKFTLSALVALIPAAVLAWHGLEPARFNPGKAEVPKAALEVPSQERMVMAVPMHAASANIPYYQDFSFAEGTSVPAPLPEGWASANGHWGLGYYSVSGVRNQAAFVSVPLTGGSKSDWLFSPVFNVMAGCTYTVSYLVTTGMVMDNQTFALKVTTGSDQTAAAQNAGTVLNSISSVPGNLNKVYTHEFVPSTSGPMCVAFFVGGTKSNIIRIDDFSIESQGGMPLPVTDLTVTPDATGEASAVVSFTVPSKTQDGSDLTAIQSCEVLRDDVVIKTYNNPAPGSAQSFTDECEGGAHTWKVKTNTADGASLSEGVTAFLGVNKPGYPTGFSFVDKPNGTITFSWVAPTTDIDGNDFNPAMIKGYRIYDESFEEPALVGNTTASPYTKANAFDPNAEQSFYQFSVAAYTTGGEGTKAYSMPVMLGKPMSLPFHESFKNQTVENPCLVLNLTNDPRCTVNIYSDETLYGIRTSYEHDNGYLNFYGPTTDCMSGWFSPLINLNAENPVVSFHYYAMEGWNNEISVAVRCEGSEFYFVGSPIVNDGTEGWHMATFGLDQFKGKNVQIAVIARTVSRTITLVDNIRVYDAQEKNVAAGKVTAYRSVRPGDNVPVTVSYINNGSKGLSDVTVKLYRDGALVAEKQHEGTLAPSTEETVSFTDVMPQAVASTHVTYSAVVSAEDDMNDADNVAEFVCDVNVPVYPVPTALEGARNEDTNEVLLAWQAPDLNAKNTMTRIEDFESYTAYQKTNISDWTLYDGDNQKCPDGFNELGFPGIDNQTMSWMVIDNTDSRIVNGKAPFNERYWSRFEGGHKWLTSWACASTYENDGGVRNDDWLISPELNGEEQVISFWARNYINVNNMPELIEVLYSKTNNSPSSFISLGEGGPTSWIWTQFSVRVPAGAKYFAIRYKAINMFMCFIDDIEFIPATPKGLTLQGYDVYRDGVKLNSSPLSNPSYKDTEADKSVDHVYSVTAVYNKGVSRGSEYAVVKADAGTVGVEVAKTNASAANVWSESGKICVSALGCNAEIYNVSGRKVNSAKINGYGEMTVAPGIYIVKAGETVAKVVVR